MFRPVLVLLGLCATHGVWFQAEVSPRQVTDATQILAASRLALGGETRMAAVKTLAARGRTVQVRGENVVPIEFELFYAPPDKYARREEIPARETGLTVVGFSGDRLIELPEPATASTASQANAAQRDATRKARVVSLKQDFGRVLLGLFVGSPTGHPAVVAYAGRAEAPQGTASVIEVKEPGGGASRLFISNDTHLPIMVSWLVPAPATGRATPGSVPSGGRPTLIEHRMYFANYRQVDGLRLPFRIRRAVAQDTTEETTFDRFGVNQPIDTRLFDLRK